ncbi:MAG TPA: hypothetical protein VL993_11485 [Stellaceae bacterium]|nr:hypothetical protein [Stellaceae bacterium]
MMRRGRAWLRRLGLRLAFAAVAIQAVIPLLIAGDIRAASTAAAIDAIVTQSLCIHDGTPAHGGAPHPDCNLACPLCAALAVATTLGTPAQDGPSVPVMVRAAPFRFEPQSRVAGTSDRSPYQSRAPPLA